MIEDKGLDSGWVQNSLGSEDALAVVSHAVRVDVALRAHALRFRRKYADFRQWNTSAY